MFPPLLFQYQVLLRELEKGVPEKRQEELMERLERIWDKMDPADQDLFEDQYALRS